jgi:hypothetical protein
MSLIISSLLTVFPNTSFEQKCVATPVFTDVYLTSGECYLGTQACNNSFLEVGEGFKKKKYFCDRVLKSVSNVSEFFSQGENWSLVKFKGIPNDNNQVQIGYEELKSGDRLTLANTQNNEHTQRGQNCFVDKLHVDNSGKPLKNQNKVVRCFYSNSSLSQFFFPLKTIKNASPLFLNHKFIGIVQSKNYHVSQIADFLIPGRPAREEVSSYVSSLFSPQTVQDIYKLINNQNFSEQKIQVGYFSQNFNFEQFKQNKNFKIVILESEKKSNIKMKVNFNQKIVVENILNGSVEEFKSPQDKNYHEKNINFPHRIWLESEKINTLPSATVVVSEVAE